MDDPQVNRKAFGAKASYTELSLTRNLELRNNSCTSSADRFLIIHSSSVESFIEQYSSSEYMSKYMR